MFDALELRAALGRLRDRYPRADAHGAPPGEVLVLLEQLVAFANVHERRINVLEAEHRAAQPADKSDDCRSPRQTFEDKEAHGGW